MEVDPVFIPPPADPIIAGGPPGGSAKLLLERANPFPFELKHEEKIFELVKRKPLINIKTHRLFISFHSVSNKIQAN